GGQLAFFQSQMANAESELAAADQALIDFEAVNNTKILQNQLASLNQRQVKYLNDQRTISFLIQDIQALRGQLMTQSNEKDVSLADQLTALSLQVQAFDAQQAVPIQIQLTDGETLTNRNRQEQIAYLDDLVKSLEVVLESGKESLIEIEPQILSLQQEVEQVQALKAQLNRDQKIAVETYLSLARKVEEEQITTQDNSNGIIIASNALVPHKQVAPRKMVNTILAGLVAAMLAIGLIFALEWWYAETESEALETLSLGIDGDGYHRQRQSQVVETESGD
ncbi:MAG: GNVR domain-containing protein, partial [Anaerolineae bacterium]